MEKFNQTLLDLTFSKKTNKFFLGNIIQKVFKKREDTILINALKFLENEVVECIKEAKGRNDSMSKWVDKEICLDKITIEKIQELRSKKIFECQVEIAYRSVFSDPFNPYDTILQLHLDETLF